MTGVAELSRTIGFARRWCEPQRDAGRRPNRRFEDLAVPLTAVTLDVAYSRLSLDEIAEPHGVSLGVSSFSLDHLHELTWMRVQLKTLALRRSIARSDPSWEPDLVAAHLPLTVTPIVSTTVSG